MDRLYTSESDVHRRQIALKGLHSLCIIAGAYQSPVEMEQPLLFYLVHWYGASVLFREGCGGMWGAWHFANIAACRAVSNPTWCGIFWEIWCLSPLSLGTLFRCCVLGQGRFQSNLIKPKYCFMWRLNVLMNNFNSIYMISILLIPSMDDNYMCFFSNKFDNVMQYQYINTA